MAFNSPELPGKSWGSWGLPGERSSLGKDGKDLDPEGKKDQRLGREAHGLSQGESRRYKSKSNTGSGG